MCSYQSRGVERTTGDRGGGICRLETATLGRLGIEGILDDARDFSVISRKYNVPNYSRSNQKITARLLVDDNSNASYVCVRRSKVEMCD